MPDDPLVRITAVTTAVVAAAAALGVVATDTFGVVAAVVSLVVFATGFLAFVLGFSAGVSRSRHEQVDLAGLFLLTGTAPDSVRRWFRALVAVQVVVAVASASARPFTELAFVVLVPVHGLGMMTWWAGRRGTFGPRSV